MKRKLVSELSLVELMITRHGFLKARKTMMFVACWVIVCESLGREPETVDEYSDWWRKSRSTGFREQAVFRACTGLDTPTSIWLAARDQVADMAKRKQADKLARQLGTLRFPLP